MNPGQTILKAAPLCAAVAGISFLVLGAAPAPSTAPSTTPSTAPATAPARGGRGGGRGGAAGGTVVTPLADAVAVDLAPPLDKTGNFKIAPKTAWGDVPPVTTKEGVAKGTVTKFSVKSEDTKMFPGTPGRGGEARPYSRDVWVYVPAGYKEGTVLPLMVDHDGRATAVIQMNLIAIMDNLIAEKRLPMMAGVFIANGGDIQPNSERSLEYDTVSGKYAEYIENEILPLAEKTGNVKFTKDPDARGVIGQSSGSPAALGMAWFHNEWYTRVISYSGTFVNIQKNDEFPRGAWAYHEKLISESPKKNIRIWMEVGSRDNSATEADSTFHNWLFANNHMADALKAKGYEYQYVWAEGAGHVEKGVEQQTLTEAMEWVWKTYKTK